MKTHPETTNEATSCLLHSHQAMSGYNFEKIYHDFFLHLNDISRSNLQQRPSHFRTISLPFPSLCALISFWKSKDTPLLEYAQKRSLCWGTMFYVWPDLWKRCCSKSQSLAIVHKAFKLKSQGKDIDKAPKSVIIGQRRQSNLCSHKLMRVYLCHFWKAQKSLSIAKIPQRDFSDLCHPIACHDKALC